MLHPKPLRGGVALHSVPRLTGGLEEKERTGPEDDQRRICPILLSEKKNTVATIRSIEERSIEEDPINPPLSIRAFTTGPLE